MEFFGGYRGFDFYFQWVPSPVGGRVRIVRYTRDAWRRLGLPPGRATSAAAARGQIDAFLAVAAGYGRR